MSRSAGSAVSESSPGLDQRSLGNLRTLGLFKKPSAQHAAQFIAHAGHKTNVHTLSYGREALFPEAKTNITSLNYLTKMLVWRADREQVLGDLSREIGFERAQFLPYWATCSDGGCSESIEFLKEGLELWHTWLWDCTGPFPLWEGCSLCGMWHFRPFSACINKYSSMAKVRFKAWIQSTANARFWWYPLWLQFKDLYKRCLVFVLPFSANSWTRTFWWHFVSIL